MAEILVVTAQASASDAVVNLLKTRGHGVTSACGFQAAREALERHDPALLLSDLRLGAFNALHLTIRHRHDHPHMQTIVLDSVHDAGIEREAVRQGAVYLVEPVDASELLERISGRLARDGAPRRWIRRAPGPALYFSAGGARARVIDISHGGVRLERSEGLEFPPMFELSGELDALAFDVRVRSIWTRPASRGWTWCGAEISDPDPAHIAAWRAFVDAIGER